MSEPIPNYKIKLAKVLRNIRAERDITQESLAYLAHINTTYYSKVERAENSISIDKLESISNALGIKLSELFKMVESV
jgi:transcriptional regulator with XRE-family HTH domain